MVNNYSLEKRDCVLISEIFGKTGIKFALVAMLCVIMGCASQQGGEAEIEQEPLVTVGVTAVEDSEEKAKVAAVSDSTPTPAKTTEQPQRQMNRVQMPEATSTLTPKMTPNLPSQPTTETQKPKESKPITKSVTKPALKATDSQNVTAGSEAADLVGRVVGKIIITGQNGTVVSPENSIVELIPLDESQVQSASPKVHRIDMANKVYKPGAIAIGVGDKIEFYNHDPIKHNVFSPSGENAFDLGTFGLRKKRIAEFKSSGLVKVYCNIHQEMATFVSVSDTPFAKVIDSGDRFTFDNVPVGQYKVSVWHLRGTADVDLTVAVNAESEVLIQIDGSGYQPTEHLNKHGEAYEKKPSLFDDEFY